MRLGKEESAAWNDGHGFDKFHAGFGKRREACESNGCGTESIPLRRKHLPLSINKVIDAYRPQEWECPPAMVSRLIFLKSPRSMPARICAGVQPLRVI